MKDLILKIDLGRAWPGDLNTLPPSCKGFATARPIEPGLSLCTIRLRTPQSLSLHFDKQPGSDLLFCRYDMEVPAFVTHTADRPVKQAFGNGTSCRQLIIVMTPSWMTANLGLLAAPDGRMTQAYNAGLAWFTYQDKNQHARKLFQRITAPSLENVIYKGMVLELFSFTWSHLTLQKRPDTYANKIA